MTDAQALVFSILSLTVIFFIWNRWRYDLVAMGTLGVSVLTGIVPFEKAFTGFSSPVVITVAAIFALSTAINQSGFVDMILKVLAPAMKSVSLQIFVLALILMIFSGFMNNIGAMGIFMPLAISTARNNKQNPAQVLMPLSFASLLGGLVTLIGTPPNLLISEIRMRYTSEPYHMFDFAPVGIVLCAAGLFYLIFSWRLIPDGRKGTPLPEDIFRIEDYVSEVIVNEKSSLVGKTIREIEDDLEEDIQITYLIRGEDRIPASPRQKKIKADDNLLVLGDPVAIKKLVDRGRVELATHSGYGSFGQDDSGKTDVYEAVVMNDSALVGMTALEASLRKRFGLNLLAVKQSGGRKNQRLKNVRFREGDIIVLQGESDIIAETLKEIGCLPLAERKLLLGRSRHLLAAPAIMAIAVTLAAFNILPAVIAFSAAVLAIAMTGVLRMDEIYESINWPIILLLGALIPVTEALQATGGDELITNLLFPIAEKVSGPVLLAIVLLASMLVTPFLNNAAAVLLMAPVAAGMAIKTGYSVDPFLMAVAVGTSCDFLTPVGHQSNTLVFGPGGYKFTDYFRLGLPLSLIVIAVGTPMIVAVWPLE